MRRDLPKAMDDRGRDLPRGAETLKLSDVATDTVKRTLRENDLEAPEGLWCTVHDDRTRAIDHFVRSLSTAAAATAQDLLKAADELMRMAGNAHHNSVNGFDQLAEDVIDASQERLVDGQRRLLRMREELAAMVQRGGWREQAVIDRARRDGRV